LISDLTMPEMTGVELAKRVSTLRPGLPIILSFGLSGALTAEELQAAGVQDFLGKPLHYEALARALKKGLRPTAGSR
jgi:FixJ family two-component response regulator